MSTAQVIVCPDCNGYGTAEDCNVCVCAPTRQLCQRCDGEGLIDNEDYDPRYCAEAHFLCGEDH